MVCWCDHDLMQTKPVAGGAATCVWVLESKESPSKNSLETHLQVLMRVRGMTDPAEVKAEFDDIVEVCSRGTSAPCCAFVGRAYMCM